MQNLDILDPSLDVRKLRFLEASAGTGKTFAISHLFVRLVEESDFRAEEIVALTFTRAAARELRERIESCLQKAYEKRPSLKLEQALQAHLTVGTVHQFAFQLLGFPLEEKELFSLEKEGISHWDLITLLPLCQNSPRVFWNKLRSSAEKDLDVPTWEEEWNLFQKLHAKSPQLQTDYEILCRGSRRLRREDFANQVSRLEKKDPFSEEEFFLLSQKEWVLDAITSLSPKKFEEISAQKKICGWSGQMQEVVSHLRNRSIPRLAKSMPKSSYDRGLEEAIDRCDPKHVQERYRALIVDEFQDTDPLQWRFLQTFFKDFHTCFVGDTKQSIYQFRGVTPEIALAASLPFSGDQRGTLGRSFRSAPGLLNGLNTLLDSSKFPVPPLEAGREGEGDLSLLLCKNEGEFLSFLTQEMSFLKVPLSEVAVLVRNRSQGARVKRALSRFSICSQMAVSPEEDQAFQRLRDNLYQTIRYGELEKCVRQWGKDLLQKYPHLDGPEEREWIHRWGLWEESEGLWGPMALERIDALSENLSPVLPFQKDGIRLLTVHGSKGLEFSVVFGMAALASNREEEGDQHLFYVLATRARDKLYLPLAPKTLGSNFLTEDPSEEKLQTWSSTMNLSSLLQTLPTETSSEHLCVD